MAHADQESKFDELLQILVAQEIKKNQQVIELSQLMRRKSQCSVFFGLYLIIIHTHI